MSGKAKIEELTNAWYGYDAFAAFASLLMNGLGIFSLLGTAFGLIVGFVVTFLIGRALLRRSSFTRTILLVVASISSFFGALGVGREAWMFMHTWQLSLLASIGFALVSVYMNVRSIRTLMHSSVRAYFG